jgi:hypothetical protein
MDQPSADSFNTPLATTIKANRLYPWVIERPVTLLVKSPTAEAASDAVEDGGGGSEEAAVEGSNHVNKIQNPSAPMTVVSFWVNKKDCTAIGDKVNKKRKRKVARPKIGHKKDR